MISSRIHFLIAVMASCASLQAREGAAGADTRGATTQIIVPTLVPSTRPADPGARVLESVDLNRVPLRDAIERLRSQTGINFFVSWNVLSHAGVTPETPVDVKLTG